MRPEPPAPAPAPAPAAPAPRCEVGERVYESLEELSEEVEAVTSTVACCPICLEDQPKADMVHVHPDPGHPDDYKLCGACAPKVKKCPFCRADSTTYVRTLADAPLPTPRTYYQRTYRPESPNSFDEAAGVGAYTSESSDDDSPALRTDRLTVRACVCACVRASARSAFAVTAKSVFKTNTRPRLQTPTAITNTRRPRR